MFPSEKETSTGLFPFHKEKAYLCTRSVSPANAMGTIKAGSIKGGSID